MRAKAPAVCGYRTLLSARRTGLLSDGGAPQHRTATAAAQRSMLPFTARRPLRAAYRNRHCAMMLVELLIISVTEKINSMPQKNTMASA